MFQTFSSKNGRTVASVMVVQKAYLVLATDAPLSEQFLQEILCCRSRRRCRLIYPFFPISNTANTCNSWLHWMKATNLKMVLTKWEHLHQMKACYFEVSTVTLVISLLRSRTHNPKNARVAASGAPRLLVCAARNLSHKPWTNVLDNEVIRLR